MSLAHQPLPADPQALQLFAADLQAELARKEIELAANAAEIHAKTLHIEKLKMQLAALRRARFGRSSEKLDRNIEQLELLISDLEEDLAAQDASARPGATEPAGPDHPAFTAKPRQRRQPVRKPLPEHLPGVRRHHLQPHRPGRARSARICPVQLQGDPPPAPEAELPVLRDHRAGADAVAADRARTARAGPDRAWAGLEVLRPPPAAPPVRHRRPRGRRPRPRPPARLGRPGRVPA